MKIQDFYIKIGGDYNEVLSRLMNENMIKKFILKFKSDDSYKLLVESFEKEDYKTAFRAVHTLKGVCSTLGFGNLYKISFDLTEELRNWDSIDYENASRLMTILKKRYNETFELIDSIE